jgi:phage tail-like protein
MPDRRGPLRNNRFRLEIDGIDQAGFSECTLPDASTEVVEYREGTDPPTVRKLGSLVAYGNLTLKWGAAPDATALADWWGFVEQGDVDGARRSIAVILQDEEGQPAARWEFTQAWPMKYDAADLNATDNSTAIETLEIAHEGMTRVA